MKTFVLASAVLAAACVSSHVASGTADAKEKPDLIAPTVEMAPGDDSGLSNEDGVTTQRTIRLSGKGTPGTILEVSEGNKVFAKTKISGSGKWATKVGPLSDGSYSLRAVATDKKTGESLRSDSLRIEVDTKAPPPPRLKLSSKPKTFKGGEAVVSGEVKEFGGLVRVFEGKTLLSETTPIPHRLNWTTDPFPLSGGTHAIHAVAVDRAGNVSDPSETAQVLMAVEQRHFALADLDKRTGVVLLGEDFYDKTGFEVAGIGDVNGDGRDDMAVGAPGARAGNNSPGRTYVLFGSDDPFPPEIDLSRVGGSLGVILSGGRFDSEVGAAINPAGDVNEDGIADLLIGAPRSGKAYLVFGRMDWPDEVELSQMTVGEGVEITGARDDCVGGTVSGGGDVNGDGIDDVALGCGAIVDVFDPASHAFIIYGRDKPFPRVLQLSSLDGRFGVRLSGADKQFGFSISINSDLDDDGIDDVVVSEPSEVHKAPSNLGSIYVLLGKRGGFGAEVDLDKMSPREGFHLTADLDWRLFGHAKFGSVAGGGDLNSDGVDDLVITLESQGLSSKLSAGFVVFGRPDIDKKPPALSELDGRDGFRADLNHVDFESNGALLRIAGDLNGDGRNDLIGGFARADSGSGESIVMFGKRSYPPILSLAAIGPEDGYVIDGAFRDDHSGQSVAGIGDLNDDGVGDLAIGAPEAGGNQRPPGAAYIVYGQRNR